MRAVSVPAGDVRQVRRAWIWILAALAATIMVASRQGRDTPGRQAPASAAGRGTPVEVDAGIGFRNRERLEEHYQKHGREFGNISQAEYLRRAQELRDAPVGGPVLELKREDGVVTRFHRESGAFIAFDPDLIIRTFFRPNAGERYFRRQAAREAS